MNPYERFNYDFREYNEKILPIIYNDKLAQLITDRTQISKQ